VDWEAILDTWGDRLYLYAKQWLPNGTEAADAVQEAFVRLWRQNARQTIPPGGIPAYCFTAVRSTALDHLRSSHRRTLREAKAGEQLYEVNPVFENTTEQAEDKAALEKALMTLPLEQREVLTLKIWGNLTFKEIATTTGISPNTAASRYRLALTTLRKNLAVEEIHNEH